MTSEQKPFVAGSDSSEGAGDRIDCRRFLGVAGAGALATFGGRMFALGQTDRAAAAAEGAAGVVSADSRLPDGTSTSFGNSR